MHVDRRTAIGTIATGAIGAAAVAKHSEATPAGPFTYREGVRIPDPDRQVNTEIHLTEAVDGAPSMPGQLLEAMQRHADLDAVPVLAENAGLTYNPTVERVVDPNAVPTFGSIDVAGEKPYHGHYSVHVHGFDRNGVHAMLYMALWSGERPANRPINKPWTG